MPDPRYHRNAQGRCIYCGRRLSKTYTTSRITKHLVKHIGRGKCPCTMGTGIPKP